MTGEDRAWLHTLAMVTGLRRGELQSLTPESFSRWQSGRRRPARPRGGSVKDSVELARHHDADLTFGRYAHTRLSDLSQVVNRLPSLWEDSAHTLPTNGVSTGLNGTTLESMEPVQKGPKWTRQDMKTGSVRRSGDRRRCVFGRGLDDHVAPLDGLTDRGFQLVGSPGLGDVTKCVPMIACLDDCMTVSVCREQQARGLGPD